MKTANTNEPKSWNEYRKSLNLTPEEEERIRLEKELIVALAEARKKEGITQKKLSEISGVTQSAIARLENSAHSPKIDTLIKVLLPLGYRLSITKNERQL